MNLRRSFSGLVLVISALGLVSGVSGCGGSGDAAKVAVIARSEQQAEGATCKKARDEAVDGRLLGLYSCTLTGVSSMYRLGESPYNPTQHYCYAFANEAGTNMTPRFGSDCRQPMTVATVAVPTHESATTVVYNQRGASVGSIEGGDKHWVYGTTGECWVYRSPNLFRVGVTHTPWGAALPDGSRRWKVWRGHHFMGRIVWHSSNRWDLLSPNLQHVGFTVGPDGPAAGAARLILGTCI
jgi:hypothetical protein